VKHHKIDSSFRAPLMSGVHLYLKEGRRMCNWVGRQQTRTIGRKNGYRNGMDVQVRHVNMVGFI